MPFFCLIITGAISFDNKKGALRLTVITSSHSFDVVLNMSPITAIPALLIKMSIVLKFLIDSFAKDSISFSLFKSATKVKHSLPIFLISFFANSKSASFLPDKIKSAPALAKVNAMSKPIPLEPPVISAFDPERSNCGKAFIIYIFISIFRRRLKSFKNYFICNVW